MSTQEEAKAGNPVDAELVDEETRGAVQHLKRPDVPVTLEDLAALRQRGIEIIEARGSILKTARRLSLQLTYPRDWLLFRNDGGIFAYLDDAGCDRIKNVWGITIDPTTDVSEEYDPDNPDVFMCSITGDGWSTLTGDRVNAITGSRMSTEDFCKDEPSKLRKLQLVRKAARANLTGSITRRLAGMRNVPLEAILQAKEMPEADFLAKAPLGRGFGTKSERAGLGATQGEIPADYQPNCGVCGQRLNYKPGGKTSSGKQYPAFWGCSNWKKADHKKAKRELHSIPHTEAVEQWKNRVEEEQAGQESESDESRREPGEEG